MVDEGRGSEMKVMRCKLEVDRWDVLPNPDIRRGSNLSETFEFAGLVLSTMPLYPHVLVRSVLISTEVQEHNDQGFNLETS